MSIFDAMRGFFGLPPRSDDRLPQPRFRNPTVGEDDDDYDDDDFRSNRTNQFSFNMFSGDFLEMHKFFEQQMDEMLKSFHSDWFSSGNFSDRELFNEGRSLPAPPQDYEADPRKKFLKPAYINPPSNKADLKDTDIDNVVDPSKVLDLFSDETDQQIEPESPLQMQPGRSQVVFSSQVVKKRILPNGAVEEERKSIKNGQEEVHLSRQLGDKMHIVTTTKLPDGTTEKHEQFINMEEGNLSEFNKAWNCQPNQPLQDGLNQRVLMDLSPFDLLKKFMS